MRPELLSCLIKLKRLRYQGLFFFVYFPKGKVNTWATAISTKKKIQEKKEKQQKHWGVLCNKKEWEKEAACWVDDIS